MGGRSVVRFDNPSAGFTELNATEFLDQVDAQTPPPNFVQKPYRTPDTATFRYRGHITASEQLRVELSKQGKQYEGFYVSEEKPSDTVRLSGAPLDPDRWNAKIELVTDQEEAMSFITDQLDEYSSVYFEMSGTYGKAGRKADEGEVFYLYRENFSMPVYRLKDVPETVTAPTKILRDIAKNAEDSYTLRQLLTKHNLILSRSDLQVIEVAPESYSTIQPDEHFQLKRYQKNLFGTPEEETIIEVSYRDVLFFYTFFYQQDGAWKQVPSVIRLGREGANQVPCLNIEEYPEETFWLPKWRTLRRPDEFCLTGRTVGGYCGDGIDRGAEVYFHTWAVTPAEARLVFSVREFSYWYASPSPEPVQRVIKRDISFQTRNYPRALVIKDEVQRNRYGKDGGFEGLKTVKSFETVLPLFK